MFARRYVKSNNFSILLSLLFIRFLTGAGIDLYVPSLPFISHSFSISKGVVQLTIGLYMLGYAVGQIFLGILSDAGLFFSNLIYVL